MASKKNIWDSNSLRTVFSNRNIIRFILGRNYFSKSGAGFTLVELLIVIAIIGIIATGLVIAVNPLASIQKAQDTKRKSDLSQIQKALEAYYNDIGNYPPNFGETDYRIKGLNDNVVAWGDPWSPYMSTLPKDPNSSKKYVYDSTEQAYYIYASLDRAANDSQACKSGGAKCDNVPGSETCGAVCNYGVSSPNVSP